MEIVIVTGMSGAGKSSVLSILEDLGYYSMDNLPTKLIIDFVKLANESEKGIDRVAIGIDIRGIGFKNLLDEVEKLEAGGFKVSILFIEAQDSVLVQRYKEHRRPHPLKKSGSILDGILKERDILAHVKARSNFIIDTSIFKLSDLKTRILEIFCKNSRSNLMISLVSFGYKRGILLDADLVFDVRFLSNPYYLDELRKLNGLDKQVKEYVFSFPQTHEFLDLVIKFLKFSIPLYEKEGKSNLIIGIGCTGGMHRSVVISEEMLLRLRNDFDLVFINHRDERYW